MGQNFGSSSPTDQQMISQVRSEIRTTKIFVISKIKCRACKQAKALLNMVVSGTGITPSFFDIDQYPEEYRKLLMKYVSAETGVTTVPQVWINGTFIGGNDDVQRLHQNGRLVPLLRTSRKSKTTKVSSFSTNNMSRSVRISPMKADVLPLTISDTPFVNTAPVLNSGGSKRRASYGRRFISQLNPSKNKDKHNRWDLARKLKVSRSSLQPRESSFRYTGRVRANTNTRGSGNNRVSSIQRSTSVSQVENGINSQIQFPSDETILRRSSVILHRRESGGLLRKANPDFFTVSGWI